VLIYTLTCLGMRYSFYLSITNTIHIYCPNDVARFKRIVLKIDSNANVLLQLRIVCVLQLLFIRIVVKMLVLLML